MATLQEMNQVAKQVNDRLRAETEQTEEVVAQPKATPVEEEASKVAPKKKARTRG